MLSTRCRLARNLQGFEFPGNCDRMRLVDIRERIIDAVSGLNFEVLKHLNDVERDNYMGWRLLSPEFEYDAPGRGVLLSKDLSVSIMINEEDHLRVQSLTAGWSAETAENFAGAVVDHLEERLDFAWSHRFGYLCASPYNAGHGRRLSVMLHLIGLAHLKRLPNVLKALMSRRIATRGLFGESSRAIGAFVQVSVTDASRTDFIGAVEYLLREERSARAEVGTPYLESRAAQIRDYVQVSPTMTLGDSLRVLGWVRWASVAGIPGYPQSARSVDAALAALEVRGNEGDDVSGRQRADFLRGFLDV